MKLDPILVRKEREERAWSQEHLAEVSALSLRTIQRVESDGSGSHETRLSLAAAFGVELADLSRPTATSSAQEASPEGVAADSSPGRRKPIWSILRLVAIGCAFVLYDLATHGSPTWSIWPLLGLGVAAGAILIRDKIRLVWTWGGIALGLVVLDTAQAGHPTWSIWVVLGWVLSVALPWLRRRENEPKA